MPRDLIATPDSDGTLAEPGYVGIYLGRGLVISAVDTEHGVTVQTYADFALKGISAIRHFG